MGGLGSGTWPRSRKMTVEESLTLEMGDFQKRLYRNSTGTIIWRLAGEMKASAQYQVSWNDNRPVFTLQYSFEADAEIQIPICLQATRTNFEGRRWWFCCPLIVGGVPCNRRASKLYMAPGQRYFACRICAGLTYRSSQEAHQSERASRSVKGLERWLRTLQSRQGK